MPEPGGALPPALAVAALEAWYGESHVLHGMSFALAEGEVVTLIGRNGAGKTTTLRAVMGLLAKTRGTVRCRGRDIAGLPAERVARHGIGYCPEERGIFASLTVEENLLLPPRLAAGGMTTAELYGLFPNLRERRGGQGSKLSGGEQQMLAIARILRTGAKLLLLDEPTEGLAPVIVQQIGRVLRLLRERGYTILLVEQNLRFVTGVADRHYLVDHGRVVDSFTGGELASRRAQIEGYLGL